jgi:RNA polymerase sigma factor (TIGR02999 family)
LKSHEIQPLDAVCRHPPQRAFVHPPHAAARLTMAASRTALATNQLPSHPPEVRREFGVSTRASDGRVPSLARPRPSAAGFGARHVPQAERRAADSVSGSEVWVNDVDDSVTGLIRAWNAGDDVAGNRLFARVYGELRTMARRLQRRTSSSGDATLDTTALVHEVYLRLANAGELHLANRGHFFAVAVRASRQILSNYARDAGAQKRGGDAPMQSLGQTAGLALQSRDAADELPERVSALEDALQQLERLHPRPCRVVECRYFGGLSIPETALALDISEATVKRDWAVAQAWLHRALREPSAADA